MKKKPAFDNELLKRAEASIAHGALTNSKRPESFVKGVYPTHLVRGHGALVWDQAGNRYIDFICGLGSNLLGYAHSEITTAMTAQAAMGATLSLGTILEIETAEAIKSYFPFIEKLRFLKTGSDACTAALIIARANNPKGKLILSEGYHGWHPEFTTLTPPARGTTPQPYIAKLHSLNQIDRGVAAVIVEPVITDWSEKRIAFLRQLRERCDEVGAFLIFDEVITGLRFRSYSVSQEYGITPDLICLGKALGNGMPLSVVGGKAALMEGDYFVSSTFAGETLSLASCYQTLRLLNGPKYRLLHLWEKAQVFMEFFNRITSGVVALEGYPTRGKFVGDAYAKALFFQESARAGLLFGPSFFFNFAHLDLMDEVLSTVSDIIGRIKLGAVELRGELPQAPYAERVRT